MVKPGRAKKEARAGKQKMEQQQEQAEQEGLSHPLLIRETISSPGLLLMRKRSLIPLTRQGQKQRIKSPIIHRIQLVVDLPMKAPTLPIRLNKQLSGGYEPHLLRQAEETSCQQQSNDVHRQPKNRSLNGTNGA